MTNANECTCPSGDGSLVHPCPAHPAVEQAGGDRWDALQSIMEWTAAKNIPDDRKLCLIRNAARAALAQPSPVRSSLLINGYQLRAALARVAEQQTEIEWLKNPKALAETVHADAQEAVKLQRLLMDSHTACRPAGEGLMGWAHAALSAQAQHSVPEGWKLVPVEPTEDVLDAIHNGGYVGDDQELRWFYQAILDAAPAPGGE
ncbi:TPA: hypothetical protein SL340_000899 [Pseudomonas aeruginosa]|nr:hypothetical protein [Pseudomonas aeruginosa]